MESSAETLMKEALLEAKKACDLGEVPVGAVVVHGGEIISRAHNEVETRKDASAHAEVLALRRASEVLDNWRLNEASLFVTLEPCTMCIGAMILSRLKEIYFAAHDPRQGAVGSLYDLSNSADLPHQIKVYSGILAAESEQLLKDFFAERR